MPGFQDFVNSTTGQVKEHSLLSPQALAHIGLSLSCGAALFLITFSTGKAIKTRPLKANFLPLILLLCVMAVASVLSPQDNLALSFFRLGEWVLVVLLFISIYTREPSASVQALIIDLIGKICWFNIAIIWLFAAFAPSLALNFVDEVSGAIQFRLGGVVIHPIRLGVLATIAFWQVFLFGRRRWRIPACTVALLTLLLSYSRIAWIGFSLSLVLYVFARKGTLLRVTTLMAGGVSLLLLYSFPGRLASFISRGEGTSNLATLSDRTRIWTMAHEIILKRPWIGYGYMDGVTQALAKSHVLTWQVPRHCQNEYLQAVASGGICAGILLALIYLYAWKFTFTNRHRSSVGFLLLVVMIQVTLYGVGELNMAGPIQSAGVLFIICYISAPELGLWHNFFSQRERTTAGAEPEKEPSFL